MGIFFTIFGHLAELWVSFSGDLSEFLELWPRFSFDLRNYDPEIHKTFYGIMGTNFLGKMAHPRQMIGRDTPPRGVSR